jgi:hypothetical protein
MEEIVDHALKGKIADLVLIVDLVQRDKTEGHVRKGKIAHLDLQDRKAKIARQDHRVRKDKYVRRE